MARCFIALYIIPKYRIPNKNCIPRDRLVQKKFLRIFDHSNVFFCVAVSVFWQRCWKIGGYRLPKQFGEKSVWKISNERNLQSLDDGIPNVWARSTLRTTANHFVRINQVGVSDLYAALLIHCLIKIYPILCHHLDGCCRWSLLKHLEDRNGTSNTTQLIKHLKRIFGFWKDTMTL